MKENKTILRLKDKVSAELYTLLTTGRILNLTLKKEWYQKIYDNEKREEYREIKDYWKVRLVEYVSNHSHLYNQPHLLKENQIEFKDFDLIVFQNGYGANAPTMIVEPLSINLGTGQINWGAEYRKFYFVIKLHKILYSEPCS